MGGPDDVERSDGVVELLHDRLMASRPDERRAKRPRGLQQREGRRVEQVVVDLQLTGQGADSAEVLQRLRELSRAAGDIEQRDTPAPVGNAP